MAVKLIRKLHRKFNLYLSSIVSISYLTSVVYHWFAFVSFMREQRAVMTGKRNYFRNIYKKNRTTRVALRRNIHRLEKALIMKPRRKNFAQNFIMETVELYNESCDQWLEDKGSYDEGELIWANNVLREYFEAIKEYTPKITEAKEKFDLQEFDPIKKDVHPYMRKKPENLPTYEQLLSLSQFRRSVRWFSKMKVSRKDIDDALLVARQSPTACNRLPYEFKIFDDPRLVEKVSSVPFGAGGYAHNIPSIAVVVGKLDSYFSSRDRHAIYVDSSLAAMGFIYALESKGIASCIINWPDFEPLERKMQKLLGLEFDERPIMLIAIGYADNNEMVPYSQKKSLENIRSYNMINR